MRSYRAIRTDAELELALAGCECGGFDVVKSWRKSPPSSVEYGSCLCGLRRGKRKPQGGWSVVVDDAVHRKTVKPFDPLKMEPVIEEACKAFSITGNPGGSPIDNAKTKAKL